MITFVDTNILLYAYDRNEPVKHPAARAEVSRLWRQGEGVLSTQVLQETYLNLTRKVRMPRARARSLIERYARWRVHAVGVDDIIAASELEQRHTLSFWDALLVVSAQRSGAERLLTEDLQHGRVISGVRIENPFR